MVEIKETSREFSKVETYLMTVAPNITTLNNVEKGTKIIVDGFMIFNDVKKDGEEVEVMSIITPDKVVYSCQSATFKKSVKDIYNIMDGEAFTIIKIDGETKAGRKYIDCVLDVESIQK